MLGQEEAFDMRLTKAWVRSAGAKGLGRAWCCGPAVQHQAGGANALNTSITLLGGSLLARAAAG